MSDEITTTSGTTTSGELGIIQIGSTKLTNIDNFLSGTSNKPNLDLESVECDFPFVETAVDAFAFCKALNSFKGKYERLKDSTRMFYHSSLPQFISHEGDNQIDMPSLETAEDMLANSAISVANFYTTSAKNVKGIFNSCPNLTTATLVTGQATTVEEALYNCQNLTTASLKAPSATNVSGALKDCPKLTTVEIELGNASTASLFDGSTSITTLRGRSGDANFKYPTSLQNAEINLPNVTDGGNLIDGCNNLIKISGDLTRVTSFGGKTVPSTLTHFDANIGGLINGDNLFKNRPNCTTIIIPTNGLNNMTSGINMFKGSNAFQNWDAKLDKLSDGTEMFQSSSLASFNAEMKSLDKGENMFISCLNLEYVYTHIGSMTNGSHMFYGCPNLKCVGNDNTCPSNTINVSLSSLKDGSSMFAFCPEITNFASDGGLPNLENGSYMFSYSGLQEFIGVDSVIDGDSGEVDASKLVNGVGMFADAKDLIHVKIKCPALVDASGMFSNTKLTEAESNIIINNDVTAGETKLSNASYMFSHTDINYFGSTGGVSCNTTYLKNAAGMFAGCSGLTGFGSDLSNLLTGDKMFCGCQLDISSLYAITESINDISDIRIFTEDAVDPTYPNENDWKYYRALQTPTKQQDGTIVYVEEAIIPVEQRGVIHIDCLMPAEGEEIPEGNPSGLVSDEFRRDFQRAMKQKGWTVTWCKPLTELNINITDDNYLPDSSTPYTENVSRWKSDIYDVYKPRITSITMRETTGSETEKYGETIGVMIGSYSS